MDKKTDKNISVAESLKKEAEYIKNNIELRNDSIRIRGGFGWH